MSSSDPKPAEPKNVNRPISSGNLLLTLDERNDTHRSITKAQGELQRIETDIAKLLERRETVVENLSELKKTLVIHRILPGDIIGYIFSLMRTERVSLPHKRHMAPHQITVSHVCSKWREIALATPVLWSDVEIVQLNSDKWVQVVTEMLFNRAGKRGISLALDMDAVNVRDLENTFHDTVLPFQVKKLHLTLSLTALNSLSQNWDDIIGNIDEIALNIRACKSKPGLKSTQFFTKVRTLVCYHGHFIRYRGLPWAHIRHLDARHIDLSASRVCDTLRQSPLLEVCKIKLDDEVTLDQDDTPEPIAMSVLPNMRVFHIFRDHNNSRRSLDVFLRSFECPNVTDLSLEINKWTKETYDIIQNHYNLHRLLKLNLTGYPFPVSKILHDAPMLQVLFIARKILFVDASTVHGISSGSLGRYLTSLGFEGSFDVKGVLDMVVARHRRVTEIVGADRGWQDQISSIKRLCVLNEDGESYEKEFMDEVGNLTKLGIDILKPDEGL